MRFLDKLREEIAKAYQEYPKRTMAIIGPVRVDYSKKQPQSVGMSTIEQHQFKAIFGRSIFCDPGQVEYYADVVYHELAAEIFAGVQQRVRELDYAFADQDYKSIREAFDKLYKEIMP
jgi:hypothetical protein